MNKIKDKIINLGANLAISYALEVTNDPKTFEDTIRSQIQTKLENTNPVEMKIAFDQKKDIFKNLESDWLYQLRQYTDTNDDRISQIKKNVSSCMYIFNEKWAMNVLKEDLPEYYSIIMTDEKPKEFMAWFSKQINDIINLVKTQI